MTRLLRVSHLIMVACMALCMFGLSGISRADSKDATALVDKAIAAAGGEDKLSKIAVVTWKSKGTISFGGNESAITSKVTMQGLDHARQEFEGDFGKGATALSIDKGWVDFGGNHTDMEKDAVVNAKRSTYLAMTPITLVQLKGKDFKLDTVPDEKVADKPVAGIKVVAPDGKDFTLFFDKESGLPVKLVAKVIGFDGMEAMQETTYSDYKDMAGIKKATKTSTKRDGEKFIDEQITDFQVLETVEPKTFTDL